MQFGKDYRREYGFSKINTLAVECAKYDHSIRYFDVASTDMDVVVQCDDGIMTVPNLLPKHNVTCILHDWRSAYQSVVDRSNRVICIGSFSHPDFAANTINVDSFPVDFSYKIAPKVPYDVVIGGELREHREYAEYVLDALTDDAHTALICCYTDSLSKADEVLIDLTKRVGEKCTVSFMPVLNDVMVKMFYTSANRIIHCGDGTRSYLHSVSMMGGGDVVTMNHSERFKPTDIKSFIELLHNK